MKYLKNHKTLLFISLVIGFSIALLTRNSALVFTTDMSYFRINQTAYPAQIDFDPTYNGKSVIGMSGFPFTTYSDCVMDFHGSISQPACDNISRIGEFSIMLNTIFWAVISFSIFVLLRRTKKPNRKDLLILGILTFSFLLLHYFVYLQNYPSTLPVLQSYTDAPFNMIRLNLCEQKFPTYQNPFQHPEYTYQTVDVKNGTRGACELKESTSLFTSKMTAQDWNPEDYWEGFDASSFMRPLNGVTYANLIFFFLQYTIIATWIFIITKSVKKNK